MGFEQLDERHRLLITSLIMAVAFCRGTCDAEEANVTGVVEPHVERSAHFIVHTDLPPEATRELLARLEDVLDQASNYWRRLPREPIECYVVDHLQNWRESPLPHPMGGLIVDRIGGMTLLEEKGAGIQTRNTAVVLASARSGVAEHEAVHAYCGQTFGVTGPAWYREGMAQVFTYGQGQDAGIHCPPEIVEQLRASSPKTLQEVVRGIAFEQRLANSLLDKLEDQQNLVGLDLRSSWNDSDQRELNQLKEAYSWSWLVCHLLYHNPNYQTRFKSLGQSYLARQTDTFNELFAPVFDQLTFEYNFMVRHFQIGYRVDLCRWDWDKRFRCAQHGRTVSVRIAAARGYQASGLLVREGYSYRFTTRGTWRTSPRRAATVAGGDDQGRGRLEGTVQKGYQLSEPFWLGEQGEFRAPCDGRLYLRCCDHWSELGDNKGSVVVVLGRAR